MRLITRRIRCVTLGLRAGGFAAAISGFVMFGGCHTYQPVQAPAPQIGQVVRVQLTGAGQDRLRDTAGLLNDRLSGTVLGASDSEISLQIRLSGDQLGFGAGTYIDTLSVSRGDAREIAVRNFSRGRTAAAIVGGVGIVAAAFSLFRAEKSSPGTGEVPDPFEDVNIFKLAHWLFGGGS